MFQFSDLPLLWIYYLPLFANPLFNLLMLVLYEQIHINRYLCLNKFLSSGKELLVLGLSVGRSVGPSKKMSKKILQLENDLSEQILENESYSGS